MNKKERVNLNIYFFFSSNFVSITDQTKKQTNKNRHPRNGKPFTNAFRFVYFFSLHSTAVFFYENTAYCVCKCMRCLCMLFWCTHSWSCHVCFYLYLFNDFCFFFFFFIFCLFHLVSFAISDTESVCAHFVVVVDVVVVFIIFETQYMRGEDGRASLLKSRVPPHRYHMYATV